MNNMRSGSSWFALAAVLVACAEPVTEVTLTPRARPSCPANAVSVAAGGSLQARVDAAPQGAVLALAPGEHLGPVRIDKALTLWGPTDATVRSAGSGSTIDVIASNVLLLGFTVDGSGGRFDLTDAAVRVHADDVRVEGLTIVHALFGVLVEKADRVVVRGNLVLGNGEPHMGLRGDGIRLWEVEDSIVAQNHVADSRDVVVWYASNNRITDNTVERSRYGTHLMYSHDNVIENNRYLHNSVGIFLMYSRGVSLRRNTLAFSKGAAGLGLGLKESGNIEVVGNNFVRNGVCVHSDNSPLNRDDHNTFTNNLLSSSETGFVFNGIATRASFRGNAFRNNSVQVRVDGGESASDCLWEGNDFDDYRGYDFDGDGIGDVPYELRSLSSQLTSRYPDLAFLRGTPSLAMMDLSSHVMPMFRPRTILVDRKPSTRDLTVEVGRAR